jgi:hypothetical protein
VVAEAWYKEEILAMRCWITILGGLIMMTFSTPTPDCNNYPHPSLGNLLSSKAHYFRMPLHWGTLAMASKM